MPPLSAPSGSNALRPGAYSPNAWLELTAADAQAEARPTVVNQAVNPRQQEHLQMQTTAASIYHQISDLQDALTQFTQRTDAFKVELDRLGSLVEDFADTLMVPRCPILQHPAVDPLETPCGHVFCRSCITEWVRTDKNCPLCRHVLHLHDLAGIPRGGTVSNVATTTATASTTEQVNPRVGRLPYRHGHGPLPTTTSHRSLPGSPPGPRIWQGMRPRSRPSMDSELNLLDYIDYRRNNDDQ